MVVKSESRIADENYYVLKFLDPNISVISTASCRRVAGIVALFLGIPRDELCRIDPDQCLLHSVYLTFDDYEHLRSDLWVKPATYTERS